MNYYEHNINSFVFQTKDLPGTISTTAIVILFLCLIGFYFFTIKSSYFNSIGSILPALVIKSFVCGVCLVLGCHALKNFGFFDFGLRWYSAMYLSAFLFCYIMMRYWIFKQRVMLTKSLLDSLISWIVLGMIAGARLAYVFVYNWESYQNSPIQIFEVWGGGLSFHGGIVGVVAAIYLFGKKYKIDFWHLADRISFTVPLGIGMGRIGNFINGELYGRVTGGEVPWAVIFPAGGPLPRHPSQLYQSLGEGWLLFGVLILIARRKTYPEGLIAVSFIGFYGLFRYFVEFYREADDQLQYYFRGTTTMGQILCAVTSLVAIGLFFIFVSKNHLVGSSYWANRNAKFHGAAQGEA